MSDETDKQSAESEKPTAEADKPSVEADKPSVEAIKPSAEAIKPSTTPVKRTKKERILIGALILAVLGFLYAAFHAYEVVKQAKDPYAQSQTPRIKPESEAELEKEEQQFQPKNVAPLPKDSVVVHERVPLPAKKVDPKAPKSNKTK
jgi:cytochrome c-type biogenesis protein CcmH/NrfG